MRGEIVQAYQQRYRRRYQRRWGTDPPAVSPLRIAFVHDGPNAPAYAPIADLLARQGAAVEEWQSASPGFPAPPERSYDAVVVASTGAAGEKARRRLRELIVRAIRESAPIAAAGPGVALLAREGFLSGRRAAFAPEEEGAMARMAVSPGGEAVVRDDLFFTATGEDSAGELARLLLRFLEKEPVEEEVRRGRE